MAAELLGVGLSQVVHAVGVGKVKDVLGRLGRLPLLAVLGDQQAKLVTVVGDAHVGRVVEVVGVDGGAEEEQAGPHGEGVQPLCRVDVLGRGAGQQPARCQEQTS